MTHLFPHNRFYRQAHRWRELWRIVCAALSLMLVLPAVTLEAGSKVEAGSNYGEELHRLQAAAAVPFFTGGVAPDKETAWQQTGAERRGVITGWQQGVPDRQEVAEAPVYRAARDTLNVYDRSEEPDDEQPGILEREPVSHAHYIELNREPFLQDRLRESATLRFATMERDTLHFTLTGRAVTTGHGHSYYGASDEQPGSFFHIGVYDGEMSGFFYHSGEDRHYQIHYDRLRDRYRINDFDVQQGAIQQCLLPEPPDDGREPDGGGSGAHGGGSGADTGSGMGGNPGASHRSAGGDVPGQAIHDRRAGPEPAEEPVELDLMILYTPAAQDGDGSSVESRIQAAYARARNALENSGLQINLRLVHMQKIDYTESRGGIVEDLYRLTASRSYNPFGEEHAGFIEHIHDLRDEYGADLVTMAVDTDEAGGISWMLDRYEGNPRLGFSVIRAQQLGFTDVLMHEIGHKLGSGHSRNQNEQPAGREGGIRDYATGWRFRAPVGLWFTTVMTYNEGDTPAPVFSSPEVTWNRAPTGSYEDEYAPADNVRSVREMKRVVAGYRPTRVDPPAGLLSRQEIQIQSSRDEQVETEVTLENQGRSGLRYELDFDTGDGEVPGPALPHIASRSQGDRTGTNGPSAGDRMVEADLQRYEAQAPVRMGRDDDSGARKKAAGAGGGDGAGYRPGAPEGETLFETVFATGQGYRNEVLRGQQNWRSYIQDDKHQQLVEQNPSEGSRHLRLIHDPDAGDEPYAGVASPYFGPLPSGSYRFAADVAISARGGADYHVYLFSPNEAGPAAWLIFNSDGYIDVAGLDDQGQLRFYRPGVQWEQGAYHRLDIQTDPENGQVVYKLDGEHLFTSARIGAARVERFYLLHNNQNNGDVADLDRLSVQGASYGYSWVDVDSWHGILAPGEQRSLRLTFDPGQLEPGRYTGTLYVDSNDPDRPRQAVPISFQVGGPAGEDVPEEPVLEQNAPNPFSGSTRIPFGIDRDAYVRLEVYDTMGRRVMVLLDEAMQAGHHEVTFQGRGLSSGVYTIRLVVDGRSVSRTMTLIR